MLYPYTLILLNIHMCLHDAKEEMDFYNVNTKQDIKNFAVLL